MDESDKQMNQFNENGLNRARAVEKLTKKDPYKRPNRDWLETYFSFCMRKKKASRQKIEMKQNKNQVAFHLSQVTTKRHSSKKNLKDLKPTLLKEMKVNQIHYGKYLECMICEDPMVMTALQTIVTDKENFQIELLSIYNFDPDLNGSTEEDLIEFFQKGTKIIIKEPHLKICGTGKLDFTLRVDSPTDIIFVEYNIKSLKHNELTEQGNKFFSQKKYLKALKYYNQALEIKKDDSRVFLNRAAVNLQLKNYHNAYNDAEKSIEFSKKNNDKAFFRMGKAAYFMRQFKKSIENFKKCIDINPEIKEANIELTHAEARLKESNTGVYDFDYMISNIKKEVMDMDVADYTSNDIKVTELKKNYKGVVAAKPIKKGTLLVVSKSVCFKYDSKLIEKRQLNTYINITKNKRNGMQSDTEDLIRKMQGDPELTSQIYSLYAGNDYDRSQVIDKHIIEISIINEIVAFNSFKINHIFKTKKNTNRDEDSALWIIPSFFNHSCIQNCERIFVGDTLFIYANTDIDANEELTIGYFPLDEYDIRTVKAQYYGFECMCKLCASEKKDPKTLELRRSILAKTLGMIEKTDYVYLKKIRYTSDAVNKMRETYTDTVDIPYLLVKMLNILRLLNVKMNNDLEAAKLSEEMYLISHKFDQRQAFSYLLDAYVCYKYLGMKEKSDWCYLVGYKLFFNKSDTYYKFLFHDLVKQKRATFNHCTHSN